MAYNPYSCEEAPEYNQAECLPEYEGKIIIDALVLKSETIPTTSVAAAITAILAAEKDGKAIVMRKISGTYDGGQFTEAPGPGRMTSMITNGTHIDVITDFTAAVNIPSFNKLKSHGINYNRFRFTGTAMFPIVGKQFTIIPNAPIGENDLEYMRGSLTIKWNGKDIPEPIFADAEVINVLEALPDLGTVTLTTFGVANATVVGMTATIPTTELLELDVAFADGAISYAVAAGSTLPAGLTLNTTNGQITGTPPAGANTYQFTIVGYRYGIIGKAPITLEVV